MKLTSIFATAALATLAGSAGAAIQTPADVVDQFAAEVRAELVQTYADLDTMTVGTLRELEAMYLAGARPIELEKYAQRMQHLLMSEMLGSADDITMLAGTYTLELIRMDARQAYFGALHDIWEDAVQKLEQRYMRNLGRIERALDRMT